MEAEYRLTEEQLYKLCEDYFQCFQPDEGCYSRADSFRFIREHLEDLK